jgi:hypothetical protein
MKGEFYLIKPFPLLFVGKAMEPLSWAFTLAPRKRETTITGSRRKTGQ